MAGLCSGPTGSDTKRYLRKKMFSCFNAGTMFCGARREYLAELNTEAATSPDFHSLLVQLDYLFSLL